MRRALRPDDPSTPQRPLPATARELGESPALPGAVRVAWPRWRASFRKSPPVCFFRGRRSAALNSQASCSARWGSGALAALQDTKRKTCKIDARQVHGHARMRWESTSVGQRLDLEAHRLAAVGAAAVIVNSSRAHVECNQFVASRQLALVADSCKKQEAYVRLHLGSPCVASMRTVWWLQDTPLRAEILVGMRPSAVVVAHAWRSSCCHGSS